MVVGNPIILSLDVWDRPDQLFKSMQRIQLGCQKQRIWTVHPGYFNDTGRYAFSSSETLLDIFSDVDIAAAGKTGTAEYCDEFASAKNLCKPGEWPSHAWTVAYAPYENPEIAVIAFVYNGGEGSSVAGPIVKRVLEAYFEIRNVDAGLTQ
jgi:hypothetical protein